MVGCNSREFYQGATYDIQTQNLRDRNLLETRIYREGKILATVRTRYASDDPVSSLQKMVSRQHEEACEKVREGSYALISLWISRGIIAYESGDVRQALEYFESVLSIDESQEEVQSYLDRIREVLDEDSKKRRELTSHYRDQIESLSRSNRNLEASRKEGMLSRLALTGRSSTPGKEGFREGLRRFFSSVNKRVLLKPQFAKHALVSIASVLLILCAGVIFTDAQIKLDPDFHSRMGKRYLDENQVLLARNIFYNLLCQDPTSEETFAQFWETFHKEGDYQVAAGILHDFLEGTFPPARTRFYLAEAYRMTSRCPEAFDFYESAKEEGWPEEACKIGMGLCLLQQNEPLAAIDLWEGMLDKGSDDFRLDYALGMAYQASGRLGRASLYFMKALKKHPAPSICRSLADCLQGMHQEKEAEKLREKAVFLAKAHVEENRCSTTRRQIPLPDVHPTPASLSTCFPFPLL